MDSLERLGAARAEALRLVVERTAALKVAVVVARAAGDSEEDIARRAGVTRMTIRSWLGKS